MPAKVEGSYDPAKRHWELGHEPHANHLTSTYRDDMIEMKGKSAAMSAEAKADLRSVHFSYGSDSSASTVGGKTAAQAAFVGLPGGPQGLPKETMADLRASHFVRLPPLKFLQLRLRHRHHLVLQQLPNVRCAAHFPTARARATLRTKCRCTAPPLAR